MISSGLSLGSDTDWIPPLKSETMVGDKEDRT